jgi:hypothetical protein
MEFDSNKSGDKSPDISDETRMEASTRQKSVAPIHDDVVADDLPDELIANQHIMQGPLANAANDSEATEGSNSAPLQTHHHHFILVLCGITVAIITALTVFVCIH